MTLRLVFLAAACVASLLGAVGGLVAPFVGSPSPGSPAPAAGGASCPRPYGPDSPWNIPIGARPRYDPRSPERAALLDGQLSSDPTQYTYPVYEVGSSSRRATIEVDGRFSDVTAGGRAMRILEGGTVRIPIPAAAQPAQGSDASIVVIDRATGDEWGAWRLERRGGSWRVENGYHYNTRWEGVPPRTRSGDPFVSRGAGLPYLAGLVRPCELRRGRIDHALAFAYDYPTGEYVYPATKSDGKSAEPLGLAEGSRLQLDPSLSADRLISWGCTGPCLVIARALQRYGMYVVDNSGRAKIMIEYEGTAHWEGTVTAGTVAPIPMSAFRVLAPCAIVGTPGRDVLRGTHGDDVMCGRDGADRLAGGAGDDVLFAGAGADVLDGGAGRDRLEGGTGADRLRALDGERDHVAGGPGRDAAGIDRDLDRTTGVEVR